MKAELGSIAPVPQGYVARMKGMPSKAKLICSSPPDSPFGRIDKIPWWVLLVPLQKACVGRRIVWTLGNLGTDSNSRSQYGANSSPRLQEHQNQQLTSLGIGMIAQLGLLTIRSKRSEAGDEIAR